MERGESPGGRRFIRNNARVRRPSRGRGRSFVLENEEISQVPQEILDKENEERNGPVENMAAEIAESSSSEPKPPPIKPIPIFTVNAFPIWRKKFFHDWREEGNSIWALCKLCDNGRYFSGGKSSFTNFNTHLKLLHPEEYGSISNSQQKIESFATPTKVQQSRQQQLDEGLTKVFTEDNLPLNLLTRHAFRSWVKVGLCAKILI